MDKAQLPVLMSIIMITQAILSTPCGLRAKRSLKDRNNLLLGGFGAMIVAYLLFENMATPTGAVFLNSKAFSKPIHFPCPPPPPHRPHSLSHPL